MEDSKIIELYFARDEDAIKETAVAYGKRLNSLAFGILKSVEDAKEAVNDTYLKTWGAIPPQRPSCFFAFTAKICRYLCFGVLDYRKAQKRSFEQVALSDELQACIPAAAMETELEDKEIGDALTDFLGTVSRDSRLIFMRRYWFCNSIDEIAQRYGVSQSKVKVSLYRTRKKLKSYLEKEGVLDERK